MLLVKLSVWNYKSAGIFTVFWAPSVPLLGLRKVKFPCTILYNGTQRVNNETFKWFYHSSNKPPWWVSKVMWPLLFISLLIIYTTLQVLDATFDGIVQLGAARMPTFAGKTIFYTKLWITKLIKLIPFIIVHFLLDLLTKLTRISSLVSKRYLLITIFLKNPLKYF